MGYITFENVSKTYANGTLALHDISFNIEEGEFVFLIGESGAGKSTVFRLLTREENPTAGRVSVEGFDLAQLEDRRIPYLRRKIGMIFQDFRLIDTLTVGENVALAMEMIGESPKKIKQRVPLVLSIVGLRRKMNHYPTQLSGGEQQRVAIARALVTKPLAVLADEPTGNLDKDTANIVMNTLFNYIKENDAGLILVTHEEDLAFRCDKVFKLEELNLKEIK